jgi:hypothetical protein
MTCEAKLANGQITTKPASYANGTWSVTMDLSPGTYDFKVTMVAMDAQRNTSIVQDFKNGLVVTAN